MSLGCEFVEPCTLQDGKSGCYAGTGSVLVELVHGIENAMRSGKHAEVQRCKDALRDWQTLVGDIEAGEAACVKAAMALRMVAAGLTTSYGTDCRAPLPSCTAEEVARIQTWLEGQKLLEQEPAEVQGLLSTLAASLRAAVTISLRDAEETTAAPIQPAGTGLPARSSSGSGTQIQSQPTGEESRSV